MRFTDRFLNDNARRNRTTRQSNQTTSQNDIKEENISEFRRFIRGKSNKDNHVIYFFRKKGKQQTGFGITHQKFIKNSQGRKIKQIQLNKNPDPNDKKKAYIHPRPSFFKENQLKKTPESNWKFCKKDNALVKKLIKNFDKRTANGSKQKKKKASYDCYI